MEFLERHQNRHQFSPEYDCFGLWLLNRRHRAVLNRRDISQQSSFTQSITRVSVRLFAPLPLVQPFFCCCFWVFRTTPTSTPALTSWWNESVPSIKTQCLSIEIFLTFYSFFTPDFFSHSNTRVSSRISIKLFDIAMSKCSLLKCPRHSFFYDFPPRSFFLAEFLIPVPV